MWKLNTDGCSKGNPGPAGIGGVLRDDCRRWIIGFYGKIQNCTSLEAELRAIHAGLKFIMEQGLNNIMLEADSEIAVKLLNQEESSNMPLRNLVEDCRALLANQDWSIEHTPREGNKVADKLTNLGVVQDCHLVTVGTPPEDLMELLEADSNGTIFTRI